MFVFNVYIEKKNPTSLLVYTFTRTVLYHVSHSGGRGVTPFACTHRKKGTGELKIKRQIKRIAQQRTEETRRRWHTGQTAFLLAPGLLGTGVPGSLSSTSLGS